MIPKVSHICDCDYSLLTWNASQLNLYLVATTVTICPLHHSADSSHCEGYRCSRRHCRILLLLNRVCDGRHFIIHNRKWIKVSETFSSLHLRSDLLHHLTRTSTPSCDQHMGYSSISNDNLKLTPHFLHSLDQHLCDELDEPLLLCCPQLSSWMTHKVGYCLLFENELKCPIILEHTTSICSKHSKFKIEALFLLWVCKASITLSKSLIYGLFFIWKVRKLKIITFFACSLRVVSKWDAKLLKLWQFERY